MNVFNILLSAIRQKCVHVNVPYPECFEYVKMQIEEQYRENIDFYLDFLQDLDLIRYDVGEKIICITKRGQATEVLFR